jgi:hypothetical protein
MIFLTQIPPTMGAQRFYMNCTPRADSRSRAGSLRFVCGLARPPSP